MKQIKSVEVRYRGRTVGTLSEFKKTLTAFQYDPEWIREGFSISPFSLPVSDKVYFSSFDPFDGLFGVFDDSLPDGWGTLLTDRFLKANGIEPQSVNSITRLSLLGSQAKGALEYHPSQLAEEQIGETDFDRLFEECQKVYASQNTTDDYDRLFSLAGSSGGARPKANISIDNEPWIIKFPFALDDRDIGEQEFRYMKAAAECGIKTAECRLLPSGKTSGYFASKRFDRDEKGNRIHMVSAGGLLEVSHRFPLLDYSHLMQLTSILTKDDRELKNMFSLMCFNVFFHNRDDHAKNFSFLYSEDTNSWITAPAYDLTYSNSINGEHATTVNGNGKNPSENDLLAIGKNCGLDKNWCRNRIDEIRSRL